METITANSVLESIALSVGVGPENVTRERTFESLSIDSLDFVNLLNDLEDTYGIKIRNRDAIRFSTVGDIADYLCSRALERVPQ